MRVYAHSAALSNEGETCKATGKNSPFYFSIYPFPAQILFDISCLKLSGQFFTYGLLFRVCGFQWFLTQGLQFITLFRGALYLSGFTVYAFVDKGIGCKKSYPMTAWILRFVVYHFRVYCVKWKSLSS